MKDKYSGRVNSVGRVIPVLPSILVYVEGRL